MIPTGLVLIVGAAAMAALGISGYLASHRSLGRSRSAALTLFGHGALATSGLLFLATLVHVHSFLSLHVHPLEEALRQAFICDLDWTCMAWLATLVAAIVLGASFLISQLVARAMVGRALDSGASPVRLPERGDVFLLFWRDPRPDAFAVALLRAGGRRLLRAEDYVLITTGLRDLLDTNERRAVLEHELAHVRARDHRYLPYVHALSTVVFFDPFLRRLRNVLSRGYEFEADDTAARRIRNPRALAQALLKVCEAGRGSPAVADFLGCGRGPSIVERIERLLTLAERMDAGFA